MSRATRVAWAAVLLAAVSASAGAKGSGIQDLLHRHEGVRAYELLDRPDVERMARHALGTAYTRLERNLRTAPPISIVDDRFVVAHGCRPHDCDIAKATLALDTKTGRILAALIDEAGQVVTPAISSWPAAVAGAAIEWDDRLKGSGKERVARGSDAPPASDVVDPAMIDGRVIYDHAGSEVMIDHDSGLIVYAAPKRSLRNFVVPGQVLFRGRIPDDGGKVVGEAYVFRKGCRPAPYQVTGGFEGEGERPTLVLRGAPPHRSRVGCGIEGYAVGGPNAILTFSFLISP